MSAFGRRKVYCRAESAETALKVLSLEFLRTLGAEKRAESTFLALSGGVEVCFKAESAETALKVVGLEFLCMLAGLYHRKRPTNPLRIHWPLSYMGIN
ncbi:hypothetical protein QFZ81_005000 [Paenibacillus sp. V4I9]|nr:hypothetical protein [Paenibacillus sp. V4I9]